jgi:acyl-CoA synthetase (AMP-forming)/AMP-acid ligase II
LSSAAGSGQLLPGTVARIVKADGSLAGYDEPGELVIKCPSVALGYANNAAAFVSSLEFLVKYLDAFFYSTRGTFIDGCVLFWSHTSRKSHVPAFQMGQIG